MLGGVTMAQNRNMQLTVGTNCCRLALISGFNERIKLRSPRLS